MIPWQLNLFQHFSETNDFSRLLISQDKDEVCLTFGTYDADYLNYLRDPKAKNKGFLKMKACGPWDVSNHFEMETLAQVLVALTLPANAIA